MKRIMVTGAGGFIGSRLAERLAGENTVYALVHSEKGTGRFAASPNIIPVTGGLDDWEYIYGQTGGIDIVYHLAWGGISSAAYKDISIQKGNILMSLNCASLAKAAGCHRFVFAGSNQEYLMAGNGVDGMPAKASVYGVCKLCARELCQVFLKDSMEFVSVAFTNVFGPGDRSKRTANLFIRKLLMGEPLDLIEGDNAYDWTYIDDAVEGLIAAGEKGINGKQYYIGSRKPPAFREILTEVRDILCPGAELNFGRYSDNSYTDYSRFDLDALYNDTGYECRTSLKEAVLKTSEWVKTMDWDD